MGEAPDLDRLDVVPAVKGSGVEPEEAPVRRVQSLPLTVNLAPQLPDVVQRQGRPALDFPGAVPAAKMTAPVTTEMQAGEVATLLRVRCIGCAHFRNTEWQRIRKIWGSAPAGSERRLGLMKMQIQLARSVLDRPPDPSDLAAAGRDLRRWGVCAALTEERKDLVIVHPEACCPEGINYYQDRSRESAKLASATFDRIMRAAQGKVG